jgi:diacylglycerol kinase (ATP)
MEKVSYRVILNPKAGKGKAFQRLDEIHARFQAARVDYEIILTAGPGHAVDLAFEAGSSGCAIVVAAGGDGTTNEVVNGLMRFSEGGRKPPVLGVLAVGRGNDFAFGSDIPSDLEKGLDCLFSDRRRPLDVGRVKGGDYPGGRYFCNGIGIGFDTVVGLEAAKMKSLHGSAAYLGGAIRTMIRYPRTPPLVLRYDDRTFIGPSTQINIMNGRRLGGIFWMAPEAMTYDGFFDLCMTTVKLSRLGMMGMIVRYIRGTQFSHPLILTDKARRFIVDSPEGGLAVHADGETICVDGTRVEAEVLPARLSIVCDCGAA